jgi:hypothetical protein
MQGQLMRVARQARTTAKKTLIVAPVAVGSSSAHCGMEINQSFRRHTRRARLTEADLTEADLTEADLTEADRVCKRLPESQDFCGRRWQWA